MSSFKAPDLGRMPPRSPRVRLGGFVLLPRILDKARASIAGTAGEYHYFTNSRLDQQFFQFTGLSSDALLDFLKSGAGDSAALEWVRKHSRQGITAPEIEAWSQWLTQHPGFRMETREKIARIGFAQTPPRDDIVTIFDLLDWDDYTSFGGNP